MKNLSLILLLLALVAGACQETTETIDIAAEKEAIIKILNLEGEAFTNQDLEQILNIHTQDEYGVRMEGTGQIYKGFEEIKTLYERYMEINNSGDDAWANAKNTKENVIIKVTGNTAWLVCDNIWSADFDGTTESWGNKQIAFFEKVDGEWKFSFNAFIPHTADE